MHLGALPSQLLLLLAAARPGSGTSSAHGWWSYDGAGQLILQGQRGDPENAPPILPAILGPNVNGIGLGSNYSAAEQPLAAHGFLDVTKSPFSADPTGKTDATAAIQAAVVMEVALAVLAAAEAAAMVVASMGKVAVVEMVEADWAKVVREVVVSTVHTAE